MELIPVKNSSNIKAVGLENGTLQVEYANGSKYNYSGVSQDTFTELLKSESKGKFIHSEIKPNYDVIRVPDEDEETE